MITKFSWIPFYEEVANTLSSWETRQGELIAFLKKLSQSGLPVVKLQDKDEQGNDIPFDEIDPFTFMGTFNRGITSDNRMAIVTAVREFLGVQAKMPTDFDGIPTLNNQRSWFFYLQGQTQARRCACSVEDFPSCPG